MSAEFTRKGFQKIMVETIFRLFDTYDWWGFRILEHEKVRKHF